MVLPLSTVSMLFGSTQSSGGVDLSFITRGSSGATATADAGSIKLALSNAAKNEAKQLADVAKDPQVVKDLARYEKVLKNADSIDDVLNDPIARKVLMTASGLKGDIDNIGLLKKAMLSDPTDPKSVAVRMSQINGAWLAFAKEYDLATNGLDRLYPQMDGVEGRWRINLDREGEAIEAMLEIKQASGCVWQAAVDVVPIPITVDGEDVTLDLLWRDADDELHTSRLTGTLDKNGLSGAQFDDGVEVEADWNATPYFKDAVDVLGSPLGREVVTVAFNIPKQIAVQSIEAQEKAINQRMSPAKLAKEAYADIVAQRYLIMLNGGLGGVTA